MGIADDLVREAELDVTEDDVMLIRMILLLRHAVDSGQYTIGMMLTPERASRLAADLEELIMLRMVPPTGARG